jgi:opine dehydrogenase
VEIAIVGAGNAGCAYACHLASTGHDVRLLKTSRAMHEENFAEVRRQGGVHCVDHTTQGAPFFAPLQLVTHDEREALRGAQVVIILTQSLQHETLARRLGPLLADARLVLVVPGYMGSLYFREACPSRDVVFAEGESTALDARIEEPGVVHILFRNVRNALAFLPASRSLDGLGLASQLFSTYGYRRKNIVESALYNPNLTVHTLGTVLSASRIEHSDGKFSMYAEAFSPSVWNVADALDAERNRILKAFGCEPFRYLEACRFRNATDLSADPMEVFRRWALGAPKGPASLNTRYIDEDIPMGLVLMSSLGRTCGQATPVCDSLVHIAGALRQRDFWAGGRTVDALGLAGLTVEQISSVLDEV